VDVVVDVVVDVDVQQQRAVPIIHVPQQMKKANNQRLLFFQTFNH
jgi:hypothetical protein